MHSKVPYINMHSEIKLKKKKNMNWRWARELTTLQLKMQNTKHMQIEKKKANEDNIFFTLTTHEL